MLSKRIILLIIIFSVVMSLSVIVPAAAESNQEYIFDEIIVTATRYPVEIMETPVSMEVITEEEAGNTGAGNVGELIDSLSGVRVMDYGGPAGVKTVHIRGSNSSQVLILMDGQPMNNSQDGRTDLGQLPLSNVERIEVLKGPASAIYGANALGGVVNIITKEADEETKIDFKAGYGSYNTKNIEISYSGREGKTGVAFTLNSKSSDGHREVPDNSGLKQLLLFSKVDYRINNNSELIFSLNFNDADKEVPGSVTFPSPNATQQDLDKNINVKWEQKKSSADTTAMIYYNGHELEYDNPDFMEHSEHKTGRTGLEVNRTNYLEDHTVVYGAEVKNNTIDSTDNGEHEFLNKALYIQDEWSVKEPLKLTAGARYDDHEKFGSVFSPRIGTVYEITGNTNVHFSAGKAYRPPTFNDLYYSGFGMEGNPDLKPEKGVAYEVGIVNRTADMQTEVNVFTRHVEDLIKWAPGDDGVWRSYNISTALIKGAELILTRNLSENLTVDVNYTYLDARDGDTEEQLKDKHNAGLGLNYSINDYSINLSGRYVGGRAEENLEDYTVVDARASKSFAVRGRKMKVALNINNLLNNEDYQVNPGYPMPDRNYMLEVSTDF